MPELDEELKDKETENLQDIDNAGEAGKEDELLSDAEIKRIADMNLDDIIEDATSDSVSVEDLFGNGDSAAEASQENADELVQAASQPEEKSDKASAEQTEAVQKQPDTTAAEAEQTETAGTQTEKSEPAEQAETQTQAEPGKEQEAAGSENQSDKKKKDKKAKKAKKDKKGFFSAVRDIFFESVEEEPEEAAGDELLSGEEVPENPKDENERVLKEMYGADGEAKELKEKEAAPKKGFFAKFKYRFQEYKKKAAEEDKAEQEAEAAEYEEKQQKKQEKKQAAQEKKEQKKQEKAAKPKKEKKAKKEKPKKEKKPKEPSKPGDILRIKTKSIILFVLLIAGIVVLINILITSFHYSFSLTRANKYLENDKYEKAYDQLAGMKLRDADEDIYRQVGVIMYVQRQYDSYNTYMEMNCKTEALNALIKGMERYDTYIDEAKFLGVGDDVEAIKKQIVTALQKSFSISESEAETLVDLSKKDFTQYYLKIEAYGEA